MEFSLGMEKMSQYLWYSPDPRMVITPEAFHLSKSLRKTINSSRYTVKVNTVFPDVIIQCQSVYRVWSVRNLDK
jgi:Leu/Phe-tRNA-protein transferase